MRRSWIPKVIFAIAVCAAVSASVLIRRTQHPTESWTLTLQATDMIRLPGGLQQTDWSTGRDGTTVFFDGTRLQRVTTDGTISSAPYSKPRAQDLSVGDNGTVGLLYTVLDAPRSRPHLVVSREGQQVSDARLAYGSRKESPRTGILPRVGMGNEGTWVYSAANSALLTLRKEESTAAVDPCDCANWSERSELCRCTVRSIFPYDGGAVIESFRHNAGVEPPYLVSWVSDNGQLRHVKPVPSGARVLDVSLDGQILASRNRYVWRANSQGKRMWSFQLPKEDSDFALASFLGEGVVVLSFRNETIGSPLSWVLPEHESIATLHHLDADGAIQSRRVLREPRPLDLERNGHLRGLPDRTLIYGRTHLDELPARSLTLSKLSF